MLALSLNLTADYANAANTNDRQTDQPASILVLDVHGNPCYSYGNKNIDWEAIGMADQALGLTEYETARLKARGWFEKLNPANQALELCRDYGIIDANTIPEKTPNTYEFTLMLTRVFHQYDFEYMVRVAEYPIPLACKELARMHGYLLDGNWWDNPESFPVTRENMTIIVKRMMADLQFETASIDKYIPKKATFTSVCQMIVDLINIIHPAPPMNPFVYSEYPVVPVMIQPVDAVVEPFYDFKGTQWCIVNNDRNETGYLSNNKPITKENVLELLNLIELAFPTGTMWTCETLKSEYPGLRTVINNGYHNPSSEMKSLYLTRHNVSPKSACGGFASLVSDLLFGSSANPARKTDANHLHPGDIQLNNYTLYPDIKAHGDVAHTVILTNVDNANHMYDYADGNNNLRVNWNEWHNINHNRTNANTIQQQNPTLNYVWYTRWPEE